jgi:hypothetical protein
MLFRESPEPGSPWEAQIVIERWRVLSHTLRPHSALGYRPPAPRGLQRNGAKSEFAACGCDVDCLTEPGTKTRPGPYPADTR